MRLSGLIAISLLLAGNGGGVQFTDVTAPAGISWQHHNGATPEKYLIETMGGGGGFLDYDNDGWLDLFLVDSGSHRHSKSQASGRHALYRNNGDGTFSDVTEKAGLSADSYGMGVAAGDVDNDGWSDLYITAFGKNTLYRNRGNGTFEDITARAGVAAGGWSTSAAFFDHDLDGDLDLLVCRYLDWDYEKNIYCGERREGYRSYCHPDHFKPISNILFRNNGNGTFTDVTKAAALDIPGKGLGVVTGDINGDRYPEIYVANDAVANFLFKNNGDGTFAEIGLIAEVAYGTTGKPESGMGTDFGDHDGDGRVDLIVTNIDYEMNNLYSNQGDDLFTDVTVAEGLGEVALLYSGFGVKFIDYDLDGDLDLTVLNGHPLDNVHLYRSRITFEEPPLLLENLGGKFANAGAKGGEVWNKPYSGRALAAGDYDNDGDSDLLFVNNAQPPVLLRNDGGNRNNWIGFHLTGGRSNHDAVGAVVTVTTNRRKLTRERHGGGSYHAAHDPRLVFGLTEGETIQFIEIRWPSSTVQELPALELRRYHQIREP